MKRNGHSTDHSTSKNGKDEPTSIYSIENLLEDNCANENRIAQLESALSEANEVRQRMAILELKFEKNKEESIHYKVVIQSLETALAEANEIFQRVNQLEVALSEANGKLYSLSSIVEKLNQIRTEYQATTIIFQNQYPNDEKLQISLNSYNNRIEMISEMIFNLQSRSQDTMNPTFITGVVSNVSTTTETSDSALIIKTKEQEGELVLNEKNDSIQKLTSNETQDGLEEKQKLIQLQRQNESIQRDYDQVVSRMEIMKLEYESKLTSLTNEMKVADEQIQKQLKSIEMLKINSENEKIEMQRQLQSSHDMKTNALERNIFELKQQMNELEKKKLKEMMEMEKECNEIKENLKGSEFELQKLQQEKDSLEGMKEDRLEMERKDLIIADLSSQLNRIHSKDEWLTRQPLVVHRGLGLGSRGLSSSIDMFNETMSEYSEAPSEMTMLDNMSAMSESNQELVDRRPSTFSQFGFSSMKINSKSPNLFSRMSSKGSKSSVVGYGSGGGTPIAGPPSQGQSPGQGQSLLTNDMMKMSREKSIKMIDQKELLERSLNAPRVLLGWQILIEDSGVIQDKVEPGIYVVTDIRKNLQRKTEFRLSRLSNEDIWVKLRRSENKSGVIFKPLRKVLSRIDEKGQLQSVEMSDLANTLTYKDYSPSQRLSIAGLANSSDTNYSYHTEGLRSSNSTSQHLTNGLVDTEVSLLLESKTIELQNAKKRIAELEALIPHCDK